MDQVTSGLYSLVKVPFVYRLIQTVLMGAAGRARLVQEIIKVQPGQRILDLGCGSGAMLHLLPVCEYVGVDTNANHIKEAQRAHGARGRFLVGDASILEEQGPFDLVLAIGLLHHLGNAHAEQVLRRAAALLDHGGRVFTLDPCYVDGQHLFAKFLIDRDSGRAVRNEPGYLSLGESVFSSVKTRVLDDLLRVPYSHCAMECRRPWDTAIDNGV